MLDFVSKQKGYTRSRKDVTITLIKTNNRDAVSFVFRNGADKKISKSGHIVVAVEGDRMYFKGESERVGYKLVRIGDCDNIYCKISNEVLCNFAILHEGDYFLEFDPNYSLWYINCE